MIRDDFPRVSELRDLIGNPSAPTAYDFGDSLCNNPSKKQAWLAREQELAKLDAGSWEFLKSEARSYLTKHDPNRGWEQFINTLNQARAYSFLAGLGCSNVRFIPPATRRGVRTPDLQGELGHTKVLCEVKTINHSDEEALARHGGRAREIADRLGPGFFRKLRSDLENAKLQMEAYDGGPGVRRIAYLVVNFDDSLAEYKERYYRQIDQHLTDDPLPGIEIVFHNQRTCFHKSITMASATVFNE